MRFFFKISITGILISLFFTHHIEAQKFLSQIPNPSIRYSLVRMDTNIDTIFRYDLGVNDDRDRSNPVSSSVTTYHRSDDKLTDTIRYENNAWVVCKYNEKNQLLYSHFLSPLYLAPYYRNYLRTDYEYDDEGRVIREVTNGVDPSTNPPTITFRAEQLWDYSKIQITKKGYIFDNREFELDDLGRITLIKELFVVDDTIAVINGKEYHVNDSHLSYTDSSYTWFSFSYIGSRTLRDEPTSWENYTYFYDEDGNEIKCIGFRSDDGINWRFTCNTRAEYKSSNTPSSNDLFPKSTVAVYSQPGTICINTEKAGALQIFDLAGRLVKQQALSAGESSISITPGLFFVRFDNQTFKIFVRR